MTGAGDIFDSYEAPRPAPARPTGGPAESPSVLTQIGAAFRLNSDDMMVSVDEQLGAAYKDLADQLVEGGIPREDLYRSEPVSVFAARTADRSFWRQEVVDRDRMIGAAAELRARDPARWRNLPTDRRSFEQSVLSNRPGRAEDLSISERSGIVPQLVGAGLSSFRDPMNVLLLPIGGGGKTLVSTVAREALLNAIVEAATGTPDMMLARDARGETASAGEIAINIAGAGIVGGGLAGAGHVAIPAIGRAADTVGAAIDARRPIERRVARAIANAELDDASDFDVAEAFRRVVYDDARTPEQNAAIHVIERQADIDRSSPFEADSPGMDAHAARVRDAMVGLYESDRGTRAPNRPAPQMARAQAAPTGEAAIQGFKHRVRRAESSGDDGARNTRSSASGRYQFIQGTFVTYYQRVYGVDRSAATAAWNAPSRRFNSDVQEALMDRMTRDNARIMQRAGFPVTEGNLYLYHFAGPGVGERLLRADPSAPAHSIFGADAMAANPHLRGKSVGQVIAWARRAVGERGDAAPAVPHVSVADVDMPHVRAPELDAVRPGMGGDAPHPTRSADVTAEPAVMDVAPAMPSNMMPDVAPVPLLRRDLFANDVDWHAAQLDAYVQHYDLDTPPPMRAPVWADDAPAAPTSAARRVRDVSSTVTSPETGLLPPVPDGHVRLYRDPDAPIIEHAADGSAGVAENAAPWFTRSPHKDGDNAGFVEFVDVPRAALDAPQTRRTLRRDGEERLSAPEWSRAIQTAPQGVAPPMPANDVLPIGRHAEVMRAFDGEGARGPQLTVDSVWHDIDAMDLPDTAMFDLGDGLGERSLASIRAEIDADFAAVEAVRGCM